MTLPPFQAAVANAFTTLQNSAGVSVDYDRNGTGGTLNAIPASQDSEVVDDDGAMVKVNRKNYLVSAADLAAAGIDGHPQRGDTITETLDGGEIYAWEVIGPGGQREWAWHDAAHSQYRIHVQRTAED
jgi:hypothetical protein